MLVVDKAVNCMIYEKGHTVLSVPWQGLSKQVDLTERQVEVWFRRRRQLNAPTPLAKFRECRYCLLNFTSVICYNMLQVFC